MSKILLRLHLPEPKVRRKATEKVEQKHKDTYVVCVGSDAGEAAADVVGDYSLAVGSIEHQFTPRAIKRNMPQPIPVMLLARLAVDQRYAGQGIAA